MVFLFGEFEGFGNGVALPDEFFLLADERVGIGESVEGLPWDFVLGDGLVLEVGVLQEEVVDEFGVEVAVMVAFEEGVADVLDGGGVFGLKEIGVLVNFGGDDPVLHEILNAGFQVHAGPAPVVHASMILINLYQRPQPKAVRISPKTAETQNS